MFVRAARQDEGADAAHQDAVAALTRIGTETEGTLDLAGAALAFAAYDEPGLGVSGYQRHLGLLALEVSAIAQHRTDGLMDRVAALNDVIAQRFCYRGDDETYDDLDNANLARVIDRRRGLPVALGILYIAAARAQGWSMVGINFPNHFLVRLDLGAESAILDPFARGTVRDAADLRAILKTMYGDQAELLPEHYAALTDRQVLIRLRNNLKARLLREGALERALHVVRSMLMIAPQEAFLWRESGLIQAHLGNLGGAIAALETFVSMVPSSESKQRVEAVIGRLRSQLH